MTLLLSIDHQSVRIYFHLTLISVQCANKTLFGPYIAIYFILFLFSKMALG